MRNCAVIITALVMAIQSGPGYGQSPHFPRPRITSENMSVLVNRLAGVELVDSAELACLTPAWLVAGLTVIDTDKNSWGMSVWGDDGMTDSLDGFRDGEPLYFLYWDPITDWERDIGFEVMDGGEAVYHTQDFLVMDFTVGVTDGGWGIPAGFSLPPPYPNPFNAQTDIQFFLPRPGWASLSLFDIRGSFIANLFAQYLAGGEHSYRLGAEGLPGGSYLLILQQNNLRTCRQIVLLK